MNKTCPKCGGDLLAFSNYEYPCYQSDEPEHKGMHVHFECLDPGCDHSWVEQGNYFTS